MSAQPDYERVRCARCGTQERIPKAKPLRMPKVPPVRWRVFTEPGLLVSLAIFAAFFVAFAGLMLVGTGKL